MKRWSFLMLLVTALFATSANSTLYELTVTRKASNLYKVDGKQVFLQTKYCYVYAYSEQTILKSDGYSGELIFLDSKDKCDFKAAYGVSRQSPGKYSVTVSRADDNWYEVQGGNLYIKTELCLNLALLDDAILIVNVYGGRLVFNDGDSCSVEAVYSKLRL